VSSQREDSTGTKIAQLALGGGGGFTKFEGSMPVLTTGTPPGVIPIPVTNHSG
jgi:hypothetical protein